MSARLRVGTRRSPLARAQTALVLRLLRRAGADVPCDEIPIETSGDRATSGSPDFTGAIDSALLRGEIDLAVHSAKDLPAKLERGFALAATPRRGDPRDALVLRRGLREPPRGGRIGSSSLRRRAQLLRWRPDLEVVEIRGNVGSRLDLVRSGRIDGAVLAVAGLERLGRRDAIERILPPRRFLPAPAQGALAVVVRTGDRATSRLAGCIDHAATRACVTAERGAAAELGGDCAVPLGAYAVLRGQRLCLRIEVLSPDGRQSLQYCGEGRATNAGTLGRHGGRALLEGGALELVARARR